MGALTEADRAILLRLVRQAEQEVIEDLNGGELSDASAEHLSRYHDSLSSLRRKLEGVQS
jgi:hypothetical protein